jgi:hypothetical protein
MCVDDKMSKLKQKSKIENLHTICGLLEESFFIQNSSTDTLGQVRSGEQEFTVESTILFRVFNSYKRKKWNEIIAGLIG